MQQILCPICNEETTETMVNFHLDKGCPTTTKRRKLEPNSPPASVPAAIPSTPDKIDPRPLGEIMRPKSLDEYIGQKHLIGPHGVLRGLILRDKMPSIILWGPSGVGKTSFARLVSQVSKSRFIELSATAAGTGDIKNVVDDAKKHYNLLRQRTILFLDEIHRFNRTQQDSLLPAVERGDITLIGATTENPSFKLQGALLSRCQVFTLDKLKEKELEQLLQNALERVNCSVDPEIVKHISVHAGGDARVAYNMLELAMNLPQLPVDEIKQSLKTLSTHDQKGDNHYDLISAFHKAVRGSDADAALYYLARMIAGGEDPLFLSRRMVRIASEDIGLADDSCLPFAVATHTAVQQIGLPDCDVILAHCAVKLARATKDVEVYKAYGILKAEFAADPSLHTAPIPLHIRNAPTKLMGDLGYSKGYKYNPSFVGPVDQEYLPKGIQGKWLGRWQPDQCDLCVEPNCEHLAQCLNEYD